MHLLCQRLGMSPFFENITGVDRPITMGDVTSWALYGSSIEYSMMQLRNYINYSYDKDDVILYGFTNHARLPFIGNEFKEEFGYDRASPDKEKDPFFVLYSELSDAEMKRWYLLNFLATLPNKKVFIDCFSNNWSGFDFHIKGCLGDISNAEIINEHLQRVGYGEDQRPNHLGLDNHAILADVLYRFLMGEDVDLITKNQGFSRCE